MQKVVGLDFGRHSLKVVVGEKSLRKMTLTQFFELPYPQGVDPDPCNPDNAGLATFVASFFAEQRFPQDTIINCAIPATKISTKVLTLPFKEKRKVAQVLPFELENYVPFDLEDIAFDFQTIAVEEATTKVLVVVAKKATVAGFLAFTKSAGFDPKYATVDALALANVAAGLTSEEKKHVAIIDLGHGKTNVCFVDGGNVTMLRSVALGGQQLNKALARALNLGEEEARTAKETRGEVVDDVSTIADTDRRILANVLKPEVESLGLSLAQIIKSYEGNTGKKLDEIYLCGGGYKLKQLPQSLAAMIGVKCLPLKYLDGTFSAMPKLMGKSAIMATPAGLALCSDGRRGGGINFRKGEFAYKKDFGEIRPYVLKYGTMAAVLFVLAFINLYSRYNVLKASDERLSKEIIKIFSDTMPGTKVSSKNLPKTTQLLQGKIAENKAKIEALQLNAPTALDVLKEISARIPKEVVVDIKRLDIGDSQISLDGETNSISSVDQMVDALKGYPGFTKIDKGDIKDGIKEGFKRFSLKISVENEG